MSRTVVSIFFRRYGSAVSTAQWKMFENSKFCCSTMTDNRHVGLQVTKPQETTPAPQAGPPIHTNIYTAALFPRSSHPTEPHKNARGSPSSTMLQVLLDTRRVPENHDLEYPYWDTAYIGKKVEIHYKWFRWNVHSTAPVLTWNFTCCMFRDRIFHRVIRW